jgi:hypothetical protein
MQLRSFMSFMSFVAFALFSFSLSYIKTDATCESSAPEMGCSSNYSVSSVRRRGDGQ